MIHDMTEPLQNPRIQWSGTRAEVARNFEPWVSTVTHGLYVQYFENDNSLPVFDKNRDFARGGQGNLVILPNGASLKPGKFQNGFLVRRRQDADHLHRQRSEGFGETYRGCLRFCLLIAIPAHVPDADLATKNGEKLLKARVDTVLRQERLLHPSATRRGDWRKLASALQPEGLKELKASMCTALIEAVGGRPPLGRVPTEGRE